MPTYEFAGWNFGAVQLDETGAQELQQLWWCT